MDIQEMIASHTDTIISGNFCSPDIACRCCDQKPKFFKLHESRKRQLRLIVEDVVKVTISFLLRWRCLFCGTTFTQYPPFVIPHKRFVLTDIKNLGERYLINDDLSYRDVVKHDGADIGYPEPNGLCDQFISHSTIWRFMGYLADMEQLNTNRFPVSGRKLETKPTPSITPVKFRSDHRKFLLNRALNMITLISRQAIQKIFPSFETGNT